MANDQGPFSSFLTDPPPGDPDEGQTPRQRLGDWLQQDRITVVRAGHWNRHVAATVEILDLVRAGGITGPAGANGAPGATGPAGVGVNCVDISKAPYNLVPNGTANNIGSSTDCKAVFDQALLDCSTSGKDIYVPGNTSGTSYDCYFSDDLTTAAGRIDLKYPNVRIFGDGPGKTVIRGLSIRTQRGRIGAINGNVFTLTISGDTSHFRAKVALFFSPNIDGSSPRTGSANPCVVTSVNAGAGTITVNDATLIAGLSVNDYVFCQYGFALLYQNPQADSATKGYNATIEHLSLRSEFYNATIDGNGNNNSGIDSINYCFNSAPRGATTTPEHTILLNDVEIKDAYVGAQVGGGPTGAHARTTFRLRSCDVSGGCTPVFASTDDDWIEKFFETEDTYCHDPGANGGSHLNYINAQISVKLTNPRFDNWKPGKYGFQHWGSANSSPHHVSFLSPWFGPGGLGTGILTNERSRCDVVNPTFECTNAMQLRTSTTVVGGVVKPATPSGTGFLTYADVQFGAHIHLIGVKFNLVNVVATGYAGGIVVDHPVRLKAVACDSYALNNSQAGASVPVPGNTGTFVVLHDGSSGGVVELDTCWVTQDTASPSVSNYASCFGSCAELRVVNGRHRGRCATTGSIRIDTKTSADKVQLVNCDLQPSSGKAVFANATTPRGVLCGWENRFGSAGMTLVNPQNLRTRREMGADIVVATATMTCSVDGDTVRVSAAAPVTVDNINLTGSIQAGFDGTPLTLIFTDGNVTVSTAGNVAAGRAAGAGRAGWVYDATAGKWV